MSKPAKPCHSRFSGMQSMFAGHAWPDVTGLSADRFGLGRRFEWYRYSFGFGLALRWPFDSVHEQYVSGIARSCFVTLSGFVPAFGRAFTRSHVHRFTLRDALTSHNSHVEDRLKVMRKMELIILVPFRTQW